MKTNDDWPKATPLSSERLEALERQQRDGQLSDDQKTELMTGSLPWIYSKAKRFARSWNRELDEVCGEFIAEVWEVIAEDRWTPSRGSWFGLLEITLYRAGLKFVKRDRTIRSMLTNLSPLTRRICEAVAGPDRRSDAETLEAFLIFWRVAREILPPRQFRMIGARWEGSLYREIGDAMQVTRSYVNKQEQRSFRQIREYVDNCPELRELFEIAVD